MTPFTPTSSVTALPAMIQLKELARESLRFILPEYVESAEKVSVVVENYADIHVLKSLHIEDRYELLGLYRGTPLPMKCVFESTSLPDTIYLYRCPLIRYSLEHEQPISLLVHQVMVHELGHHFGEEIGLYQNGLT